MVENWKNIWNKRKPESEDVDLAELIKLDGFDTGAGRIEAGDWRVLTNRIAEKLGLQDGDSVFEVGCGAGAFLYSFLEEYDIEVGGIDYAENLIKVAKKVFPGGDLNICEAKDIRIKPQYDYVISNAVFHYFEENYAAIVLDKMIKKCRKAVAVFDVPDLHTKEESEAKRQDKLTEEDYKKKYEGLEHTYYSKKWFIEKAKKYKLSYSFLDGVIPNYAQNKYRFGVIMVK